MLRKNLLIGLTVALSSVTLSVNASVLVIDNFTDGQSITDTGSSAGASFSGPMVLTGAGSEIAGIQRTLIAEAAGPSAAQTDILLGNDLLGPGTGGLLSISNNTFSTGTATLIWDGFAATDFTAFASSILMDVVAIDLDVNVELIVNGISSSGTKFFTGTGNFFVDFSDFSDPGVFTSVTSFQMNLTGPQAWDGQFRLLAVDNNTTPTVVPEPSTWALLGVALVAIGLTRKTRSLT
ncbi:MAG: PEP-CTERM sorting domain-containing protein [Gammaproteobacteria bacterium]